MAFSTPALWWNNTFADITEELLKEHVVKVCLDKDTAEVINRKKLTLCCVANYNNFLIRVYFLSLLSK